MRSSFVHSRLWALTMCLAAVARAGASEPAPALIPQPKQLTPGSGTLEIGVRGRIVATDASLQPLAEVLAGEIERLAGHKLTTAKEPAAGDIVLTLDGQLQGEAYRLEVTDRALVRGGNYDAVATGTASLLQALRRTDAGLTVPRLSIADEPSYPFRAALIDLARKYHTPGGIEQVIDLCRFYKIRYLHLHLTDDQLFMFPSQKFPQAGQGNHEFARFEPPSAPKIAPYAARRYWSGSSATPASAAYT